jgi:APA family basic amino acid/polyamine antiporter
VNQESDLPRRIGFWGGSAIMVGIIIGSGIFRTPPSIAKEMGSPWLILCLWVAGGALSFFGALTYAELGAMYPRSGGIYVYLHQGLGPLVAFVFGWTYLLITKPLAAAGIAMVFGESVNKLFGISVWPPLTVCVVIVALTALNTVGVKAGTGLAMVLTAIKVGALVAIVALALVLMKGSAANFAPAPAPKALLYAIAPVMAAVLWTYDGWSDVGSIAGEVTAPQKKLPLIFLVGTGAVTLLYVAVNAVYMAMVPLAEMRTMDTIADVVMGRLVGAGESAVLVLVILSTLGSTHGSIITGARITFAQARDGLLFRFLGHVHPRFETPDVSLVVQAVLSCAAVLVCQTFERLAGGFVFTMWIFYALAGVAILVLRVRKPDAERPYRCWGYPVVPVWFILSALAMTVLSIVADWKPCVIWLAILVAGAPVYYLWRAVTRLVERRRAKAEA